MEQSMQYSSRRCNWSKGNSSVKSLPEQKREIDDNGCIQLWQQQDDKMRYRNVFPTYMNTKLLEHLFVGNFVTNLSLHVFIVLKKSW